MLSNLIEDWARGIARQVARFIAKTGLSPNSLTVIGFILTFPTALVLAQGQAWSWFLGGFLVLFAGAFDMLDGAVAKVTNRVTKFGAFLDSNFDRYGEIVTLLGLLLYYRSSPSADQEGGSILVYVAITGSVMVSYTKARAEGLNMECKGVGLMPRPERVILTAAGAILTPFWGLAMIVVLWILALGTHFTAAQRIGHIWLETNRQLKIQAAANLTSTSTLPEPALINKETLKEKEKEIAPKEDEEGLGRKRWSFRRAGER